MGDFVIITCLDNKEEVVKKNGILDILRSLLGNIFHKQKVEDMLGEGIKKIMLFEEAEPLYVHHIPIPLQLNQLGESSSSYRQKLEDFIKTYCSANNIHTVILPDKIREKISFQGVETRVFSGKTLFKSIFPNIMNEIYARRGIKIRELDIAIVQGKSQEELLFYIGLLAPMVKYLTIISQDKEEIENRAENIYEETGLCIRVTNDGKNGLKNADFILNLGEMTADMRTHPGAVVLNYGDMDFNRAAKENIVIRGVEVKLPAEIRSKLEKRFFDFLSSNEMAEIILSHKLGVENAVHSELESLETYEKISKEFTTGTFAITGFIGRRNQMKPGEIKLPGRLQKASGVR